MIAKLFERAEWYMPGISSISVERSWTGFRAATPDGLPLIGRYDETEMEIDPGTGRYPLIEESVCRGNTW